MYLKQILRTFLLGLLLTAAGQGSAWATSTFKVTASTVTSGTKFRITRTGNTAVAETVDWRIVSLSALEGIHYTGYNGNYSGSVTFNANDTIVDVTITERTPTSSDHNGYKFYSSGTTRSYRFEVLDKDGYLLASCDRSKTTGTSINSSSAFGVKNLTINSGTITVTDGGYAQAYHSVTVDNYYSAAAAKNYLVVAGAQLRMTVTFDARESDDGYQYIQIYANTTADTAHTDKGAKNGNPGSYNYARYVAGFTIDGNVSSTYYPYTFPVAAYGHNCGSHAHPWSGNSNGNLEQQYFKSNCRASDGRLIVPTDLSSLYVRLDASGNFGDNWYCQNLTAHIQAVDTTAPTVLNNYKVSAGRHQKGNTFYVSVPFSEIVVVTGTPKLESTWGDIRYLSGSGSNVLTFKGTITSDATQPLNVTSYTLNGGTIKDLAGNSFSDYSTSIRYNFGTTLDDDYAWSTSDFRELATNTYEINTKLDLRHLALLVNKAHNACSGLTFQQSVDITCDNTYIPIGYKVSDNDNAYFRGTYDGQGHTVSGITVTRTGTGNANGYVGLFGYIDYNSSTDYGIVRNVVLASSTFTGCDKVGGIVGLNWGGTVENCRVESSVTINAGANGAIYHGGIVGHNYSSNAKVIGCYSAAAVSNNGKSNCKDYGGIVGCNYGGTVKDCLYAGTAVTAADKKGAIVGYDQNNSDVFSNNYHTSDGLGGVAGSDCDGARRARIVVLNEHVALVGEETAYSVSGLTAIGTGNYALRNGSTIYSGETQSLILTYSDVPATGNVWNGFSATPGTLTGNTLTMPAAGVTVSATTRDVWGVTNSPAADGSEDYPYLISDTAGLNLLARHVNGTDGYAANGFDGKFFRLANNITYSHEGLGATESNYTAIGGYSDGWISFNGTFDGDGHTVSGIRIYKGGTTAADGGQGLFGDVLGGTIKNVTLTDAVITGKQFVGGIVGTISMNNSTGGIIENCHVTGSVTIHAVVNYAYWHGGIVGKINGGSVSGCTSAATLSYASGLTGCYSYGGIAGQVGGNLQNCLVLGATVSGTEYVGAVAGNKSDNHTYTANYYRACTVNGTANAINVGTGNNGDIAGVRSLHTLTLADGVTASGSETKVIGTTTYYASTSTITLAYVGTVPTGYTLGFKYNDGTEDHAVTGNSFTMPSADATASANFTDVWGVTNTPAADGTQEHPYVISDTTGLNLLARNVNGTHGYAANGFEGKFFRLANNITYSYAGLGANESNYTAIGGYINDVNRYFRGTFDGQGDTISGIRIYKGGDTDADGCQGLFGMVSGGTIKNVTLTDAVITGKQYVGGIAGYISMNGSTGGIIDNCHVTGSVTLHAVANNAYWHGGIVGNVNLGTVSGCTSTATLSYASGLTDCSYYGGIVGENYHGTIENCLVLGGTVSGTYYVDPVVGRNTGPVTNCHHRHCSVNAVAQNDLYAVVAGTDVTLSPAGTATTSYPYSGIEVYGSALLYGDTLYATDNVSVGLTLGYTGTSAHHYGYEASSGTLTGTDNPYNLTLAAADVVVDAITCEHGNNAPSFDLDVMDVCVGSDGNWAATLEALSLGTANNLADDYTPVDQLTVTRSFDTEPYDPTTHPYGYSIAPEGYRDYLCTWTVTDGCGSYTSHSNHIIVYPLPLITITDSLQTVAYGEAIETMNINVAYQSTYTVTGSAEGLTYDQGAHKLEGTPTEVGTYNYSVEATSQWGCASRAAPITITVTPRPITITATDATKEYDGTPLTSTAYTCSLTAPFTADQVLAFSDVIASINITGSQTIVGSNSNTPSALVITDGGNPAVDKTSKYDITYQPGTLTVTPNTSDITVVPGSGTKVYDGTPLTKTAHEDFTVTGVPDGFTWTATADGTVTNVIADDFDYDNEVNAVSSFVIRNAAGEDVTDNFSNIDLSATGTLTVTPREATVRACVAYKPYDGTSLTCTECTYSGIVEGDTVVALASGKQTQIGTSPNTLINVFVFNADEELVTDNYHITKVHGTLTVTPRVDINAGRWHAVSTPMHDHGEEHWTFGDALTTGLYDLFRYDEPTATWENHKSGNFDHMAPARGYLYRSSADFAIPYDGLFNSEPTYSIGLTASGSGDLRGFNLVGNPYPYRVKLDRAFYSLNADGSWTLHPNGDSIAAGQGALVYASAPETLTFYAATRSTNAGKKGALPHIYNVGSEMDEGTSNIIHQTSDIFARWDGDHLVITGTGLLQAFDALGRQLFSREMKNEE